MQGQGTWAQRDRHIETWKQDSARKKEKLTEMHVHITGPFFHAANIYWVPTKWRALCMVVNQVGQAELSDKRPGLQLLKTTQRTCMHTYTSNPHSHCTTLNMQHSQKSNHFCRVHHFSSQAVKILLSETFKYMLCFCKYGHEWEWHLLFFPWSLYDTKLKSRIHS